MAQTGQYCFNLPGLCLVGTFSHATVVTFCGLREPAAGFGFPQHTPFAFVVWAVQELKNRQEKQNKKDRQLVVTILCLKHAFHSKHISRLGTLTHVSSPLLLAFVVGVFLNQHCSKPPPSLPCMAEQHGTMPTIPHPSVELFSPISLILLLLDFPIPSLSPHVGRLPRLLFFSDRTFEHFPYTLYRIYGCVSFISLQLSCSLHGDARTFRQAPLPGCVLHDIPTCCFAWCCMHILCCCCSFMPTSAAWLCGARVLSLWLGVLAVWFLFFCTFCLCVGSSPFPHPKPFLCFCLCDQTRKERRNKEEKEKEQEEDVVGTGTHGSQFMPWFCDFPHPSYPLYMRAHSHLFLALFISRLSHRPL